MERIVGEHLYLKEIQIEELTDSVMAWFADKDLMKFYTNSQKIITKDSLIVSIEKGKAEGNVYTYGIYSIQGDILIGTVKLGPINKVHKTSDLATLIGNRDFLGKGLAPEAIKLGNQLAFNAFDLRRLATSMYLSNIASIKAYMRAGWLIEGRLKGYYHIDGKNEDQILAGCFNPKYFTSAEIEEVRSRQKEYYE